MGELRAGWLLALSLAAYAVVSLAARYGLNAMLSALFSAWGIEAANAWRAPGWARLIYAWHGSGITVLVSAAVIALCAGLRRLWKLRGGAGFSARQLSMAWLLGTGAAVIIAALCLLPDSLRAEWPLTQPRLSAGLPALWLISLIGTLAEECFSKRVIFDGVHGRWGRPWALLCGCALFFLTNGGYAGNVLCAVNVLLLGLAGCLVYEKYGLWAAAGLRWGWSFATVFVLGFGGGEQAVYRLYHVSERWLTGGDAGFIYGFWATLALSAALLWLEREAACRMLRRLKKR